MISFGLYPHISPETQHDSAPDSLSGVATNPAMPVTAADTDPSPTAPRPASLWTLLKAKLNHLRIVARGWFSTFLSRMPAILRAIFGEGEVTLIGHAELHRIAQERYTAKVREARIERAMTMRDGYFCLHCDAFHVHGFRCPTSVRGICVDCGRMTNITKDGTCTCGSSSIVRKEMRWPRTRGMAS